MTTKCLIYIIFESIVTKAKCCVIIIKSSIYTLVNDYSFEAAWTDLRKSIVRIKNANEPRIAGII